MSSRTSQNLFRNTDPTNMCIISIKLLSMQSFSQNPASKVNMVFSVLASHQYFSLCQYRTACLLQLCTLITHSTNCQFYPTVPLMTYTVNQKKGRRYTLVHIFAKY